MKYRIALQLLQMFGPLFRPGGRIVATDSGPGQRAPDDIAHGSGIVRAEGSFNADPTVCPEVFQRWLRQFRHGAYRQLSDGNLSHGPNLIDATDCRLKLFAISAAHLQSSVIA